MSRKKKDDDWIAGLLALGIGFLAVTLLSKANQNLGAAPSKTCMYCGHTATKWAIMCPRCRNSLPL